MPVLDSIWWELSTRLNKAQVDQDARTLADAGTVITRSLQGAEDQIAALITESLKAPEALAQVEQAVQDLLHPLDAVSIGLSEAASGTAKWDQGLRLLAQQEAEAAVQAQRLAQPLGTVALGMTAAASGAGKWEQGLRRLALQSPQVARGSEEAGRGTGKLQNALVSLALQGTQTSGAVGKLIEGLLLMGAGSLAVTGAAAGVAIIAAAWNALTRKQREAREAQDRLIQGLREGLSTPVTKAAEDLRAASQAVDELRAKIQALRSVSTGPQAGANLIGGLGPAGPAAAPHGIGPGEEDQDRLNALLIAQNRARAALTKAQAEADKAAADERRRALEDLRRELVERFTTAVPATIEATAAAVSHLTAELQKTGAPAREVDQAITPLLDRLRVLRELALGEQLAGIEAGPSAADSLAQLERVNAGLIQQQTELTEGSADELAVRRQLAIVAEAIARTNGRIASLSERTEEAEEGTAAAVTRTRRTTAEIVDQVAQIARGAIGVAQAFGLASDGAAAMLHNVLSVAESLPTVIDQLGNVGKLGEAGEKLFDPSKFAAGVVGVLGGLAGVVSSLFGESADARRDREIREQNTQAIRELTKTLATSVTGASASQARDAIDALLGRGTLRRKGDPDFVDVLDVRKVNQTLAQFGLTLADLEDQLKAINPNLTLNLSSSADFVDSLKQIREALAELNFRAFADSFTGQLALLQDRFDLMDLSNPLEQLQAIAKLAQGKSPILKELLGGVDLSTAAGRAEAERRILEVFDRLGLDTAAGGFTAGELGKLSSQELRDLLKQLEGLIDQVNADQGTQTGGGPLRETTGDIPKITEARGAEIAGILTSIDTRLVEQVGVSKEIRDLLASVIRPGGFIPPPPLPVGTTAAGAGGLMLQVTQNITIAGTATDATLRAAGQTIGASAVDEMSKQLGRQTMARLTWLGVPG